jgi:hypothetical protein
VVRQSRRHGGRTHSNIDNITDGEIFHVAKHDSQRIANVDFVPTTSSQKHETSDFLVFHDLFKELRGGKIGPLPVVNKQNHGSLCGTNGL